MEEVDSKEPESSDSPTFTFPFYVCPTVPVNDFNVYAHYVSSGLDSSEYAEPNETDENGNPCVDIYFLSGMGKCILDDSNLKENEFVVMQILLSGIKQAVIKRDTDLLTTQELKQHYEEVQAAILEELIIWQKYKCFSRDRKSNATNLMTSKFVAKWKWVEKDGKRIRIIRMRLAVRGFQDNEAEDLITYSATGSRTSQKIINSECACRPGWVLVSVDIDKAFLQGMTYEEIHELTGEGVRNVHFSLPPGADEQLRKLPGFEGFDSRYECLKCDKPGTGTKDAPRAFSLKLASVTQGPNVGMKPTFFDREFEVQHNQQGDLTCMNVKHVDDLKLIGPESNVEHVITELEKVFGKLKRNYKEFTNCGIRHKQLDDGSVELDQDEYIQALIPISHPELVGANAEDYASEVLIQLFWSLLGAVAYTLMTQHWIAVYIIALQRETHKPKIIHIRRLNAIVRALQKLPSKIKYPSMKCSNELLAHSDSGFSKEQDKGYGIRGSNIMRKGTNSSNETVYHLLESVSRSHKQVTRSTFSAETLAAVACADDLIPLLITFHEIKHGPITAHQARELRENGGLAFKSTLAVDAMSLFTAVAAHTVKIPQEKNLAIHLFWLRELLDNKVLSALEWCDTRDMSADCHTKGSIARDVILALMNGELNYTQQTKTYPPK